MNSKAITNIIKIFKPLFSIYANTYLPQKPQRVILTYHGISDKRKFNCISNIDFKEHLVWLKKRYSIVPLSSLIKYIKMPANNNENMLSITFDDAYVNFQQYALPVLEEFNCHATVFVPTGKVASFNSWDEHLKMFNKMKIMSFSQLKTLPEKYVEIGSHGVSHKHFNQLSLNQVSNEIIDSRIMLEQKLNREIKFFSFPYGVYPFKYFSECKNLLLENYKAACLTQWGRNNYTNDLYSLQRIGIWETDTFNDFINKMKGYYDWLTLKEKVGVFYKTLKYGKLKKIFNC